MHTRFCIIRHGETDWNIEKRIQGHTDIPLNATGRAQALAMAFNAGHHTFHAIYSSDLQRAHETAQALINREGLPVQTLEDLRERHYGIFQGLTASEAAEKHPHAHKLYKARNLDYDFEHGESMHSFVQRIDRAFEHLIRHYTGQSIAVVSHAGVLDVLYRRATGRPLDTPRDFQIPNCGLNWFRVDSHGWHIEEWADRHHLTQVLTETPE